MIIEIWAKSTTIGIQSRSLYLRGAIGYGSACFVIRAFGRLRLRIPQVQDQSGLRGDTVSQKQNKKTKEAMTVTSYVQPFPWPLGSCRGSEINEVYLTHLSHQA